MPLITMPREMGTLGKDVAASIAQRLGKSVVHHEITDVLANKMRLRKSHVVRFLETDESRQKLHDLGIISHVRAALRLDQRSRKLNVLIESTQNHVTLSGVVDTALESAVAADIAAQTPGVCGVTNLLQTTSRAHHRLDS